MCGYGRINNTGYYNNISIDDSYAGVCCCYYIQVMLVTHRLEIVSSLLLIAVVVDS